MKILIVASTLFPMMIGVAEASPFTPPDCDVCTVNAQASVNGSTPFPLENINQANIAPLASQIVIVPGGILNFPINAPEPQIGNTNGGITFTPFGNNDTTREYLAEWPGAASISFTFNVPQQHFNLLWGSPSASDHVMIVFIDGDTGIINGDDIIAAGGPPSPANAAVEITTTKSFTFVNFWADEYTFEFVPGLPDLGFAGVPGQSNCIGVSINALTKQYGGMNAAATALDEPNVPALQQAVVNFCK